jgi:uncharacterized protein YndB with AHSA1/START domain
MSDFKIAPHDEREIVITRTFAGPRARVYDAWTKPALLKQWLGRRTAPMDVCEMEVRPGGTYRWAWRLPDGSLMGMGGTFREVVPNERISATEKFDQPWYPGGAIVTTSLAEEGGKTKLTTTIRYDSREARDGVLKMPMKDGIAESYERLDALLAKP